MKILDFLHCYWNNTEINDYEKKRNETQFIYPFHFFLLLSLFPEFLDLNKEEERLLYRGRKNRKGRGRNITKKRRCAFIFIFPQWKEKIFFYFLLLHSSLYQVCSSLSIHSISISINNWCVLTSKEYPLLCQVLKMDNRLKWKKFGKAWRQVKQYISSL